MQEIISRWGLNSAQATRLERHCDLVREVYFLLNAYFDEPMASQWIRIPNYGPEFVGMTPLQVMVFGGRTRIERVRDYLRALMEGY